MIFIAYVKEWREVQDENLINLDNSMDYRYKVHKYSRNNAHRELLQHKKIKMAQIMNNTTKLMKSLLI